jgi:hypothetical protein
MTLTPPQLPEGVEPPTQAELDAWRVAADEQNAYIFAKEQAEADRQTALAQPLTALSIDGATVAEVKASAETAIADLATQMQAKIDAIAGGV